MQDIAGNVVLAIPDLYLRPCQHWKFVFVSDDGSLIAAQLYFGMYIWFVSSGRESQLSDLGVWICSPAISNDGRLMAICLDASSDSDHRRERNRSPDDAAVEECFLLWNLEDEQASLVTYRRYPPSVHTEGMLFSKDSKTLRTDKGNLDLETGEWTTDSLRACRDPQRPPSVSISGDRSWILYDLTAVASRSLPPVVCDSLLLRKAHHCVYNSGRKKCADHGVR